MFRKIATTLAVAALFVAGLAAPARASFSPGNPCERPTSYRPPACGTTTARPAFGKMPVKVHWLCSPPRLRVACGRGPIR